jgi:hypothetical protein
VGIALLSLMATEAEAQCGFVDIAPTAMASGSLGLGDCTIADLGIDDPEDTSFVDLYRVTLPTDGYLTVRMDTAAFDTFLYLTDPALTSIVAIDDDGGSGINSRISLVGLEAGSYLILANSFDVEESGPYTLTTQFGLTGNPECLVHSDLPPTAIADGSLSVTDCTLTQLGVDVVGRFADQYHVTLATRGQLSIRLESPAFDAFLWLFDPTLTNLLASDDDGTGTTDSLISSPELPAGTYVILANSFAPGETGRYTLTVIPEPSALALGLAALGMLLALEAWRKRTNARLRPLPPPSERPRRGS